MGIRAIFFFFFAVLQVIVTIVGSTIIIDFVPEQNGAIEKRQISTRGPVRLVCKGPGTELSWEFGGGLSLPTGTTETVEEDARIVDIQSMDEDKEGIYACSRYETGQKKRMRLYFFDDTMPAGFHECSDAQKGQCVHAKACRAADDTEHLSCVCMKDWQGEKCDTPVIKEGYIDSLTTGIPLIWIFLAIVALVAITLAIKCHTDDERSERVPTTDPGAMV